jgi:hypothetical protein
MVCIMEVTLVYGDIYSAIELNGTPSLLLGLRFGHTAVIIQLLLLPIPESPAAGLDKN